MSAKRRRHGAGRDSCDCVYLEECRGLWSLYKKKIRRAKRGHEIALADMIKENP